MEGIWRRSQCKELRAFEDQAYQRTTFRCKHYNSKMQPDIARLLRENNLRYGDKFKLITEDESLRPIYFIAPEINR